MILSGILIYLILGVLVCLHLQNKFSQYGITMGTAHWIMTVFFFPITLYLIGKFEGERLYFEHKVRRFIKNMSEIERRVIIERLNSGDYSVIDEIENKKGE